MGELCRVVQKIKRLDEVVDAPCDSIGIVLKAALGLQVVEIVNEWDDTEYQK